MPNHCENDLYISGPKEDVERLLALVGADKPDPEFDFNAVLPYPASFKERDDEMRALQEQHGWAKGHDLFGAKYGAGAKDGYNSGGYEWCCKTWGTKWNAYEVARRDYGGPCVTFQTAWNPPVPVIAELHRLFPMLTLSLEYFELGVAFCGGVTFRPEDDHYGDTPWKAGEPSESWHLNGYRGRRGG